MIFAIIFSCHFHCWAFSLPFDAAIDTLHLLIYFSFIFFAAACFGDAATPLPPPLKAPLFSPMPFPFRHFFARCRFFAADFAFHRAFHAYFHTLFSMPYCHFSSRLLFATVFIDYFADHAAIAPTFHAADFSPLIYDFDAHAHCSECA
jgi:hypothetical protein